MTLSFRQKVVVGYLIVLITFLVLLLIFASLSVKRISLNALQNRANELIAKVESAPSDEALVRRLKAEKEVTFFRVTVINEQANVLYDSLASRNLGPFFTEEFVQDAPEVSKAFESGIGYYEEYSDLYGKSFAFMAKTFDFQGKTYVMRTAFPLAYVEELTRDFRAGFLTLGALSMIAFSLATLLMIGHLSKPIHQIIDAIRPYERGSVDILPEIALKGLSPQDDFSRLAQTLNSLSLRIQKQISILTVERNEKTALLEALIEGVIAVDSSFRITYANPMALKMLGKTQQQLFAQDFDRLGIGVASELLHAAIERGEIQSTTFHLRQPKELTLDLVAAPFKQQQGAILVLQDTSIQHQMLNIQRDFIANASHELKTPITIVRGFAETLRDNLDLGKEMVQTITEKITRNCERMNTLVSDLLRLANLERLPEFLLQSSDLIKSIERCKQTLLTVYPHAEVSVDNKLGNAVEVFAHSNLLEQAILNLLTNAAKYSEKETPPVFVSVDGDEKWISLEIADRGIGIPAEDLEHIFERFYRVDKARTRKMGGTGLGLSIVKTIIEKHRGTVSVRSEEGKGSTFTIRLPRSIDPD